MASTKPVHVVSTLGEDVLMLYRATVTEELGRLFRIEVDLLCDEDEAKREPVKLEDIIGTSMTVTIDLAEGEERHYNGIVSRFSQTGRLGRYTQYHATIRPWLWLLTRTSDCRIYPDLREHSSMTIPDIVKAVFRKNDCSDFEDSTTATYKAREFCVQYRETDFNFVSRLMEEEGMYYYFRHEKDKHHLVLCDGGTSHDVTPGCDEVPFIPSGEATLSRHDHIHEWCVWQEVQPGAYALTDFDMEITKADLTVKATDSKSYAHSSSEIFDHPGFYVHAYSASGSGDPDAMDRGQMIVQARLDELQTEYERVRGVGNVRPLMVGGLFNLKEHQRTDQNRKYMVISTVHEMTVGGYEGSSSDTMESTQRVSFTAIDSKLPFRPRRITPKPVVTGLQTAMVVGKSGEEIWTDMHGRVKVQFHWDRHASGDENSSCWVRVSQAWAGKQWGSIHVPRMGHEVIVAFLEGDPDRPIIVGRVYDGQNKPPYELPANATQSGIKSRSSKGGSPDNFNEFRFEDKKGEEHVYLHAEKDWQIKVENDETKWVGHDQTHQVDHDRTRLVKNDETLEIQHDRKKTVKNDQLEHIEHNKTIKVDGDHNETVMGNMTVTVNSSVTETVTSNYSETVGVAMEMTVGGALTITAGAAIAMTAGGALTQSIGGNSTETVGKNKTLSADGDLSETVKGKREVEIEKEYTEKIGKKMETTVKEEFTVKAKKVQIVAEDEISLESGDASIVLKKGGDITIKGGKIKVEGSGDVILKGSKIAEN